MLLVLLSACAPTDEPYVPKVPSSSSETDGPITILPGPTNPEVFQNIERAEILADGAAVAFETRAQSYTVSVVADGQLHEVTLVGSGVIVNTVRDVDEGVEEFLETQVVTLADAIDAAAIAHPGRVVSARINLQSGDTSYDVLIESEDERLRVVIDGYSAEVLEVTAS